MAVRSTCILLMRTSKKKKKAPSPSRGTGYTHEPLFSKQKMKYGITTKLKNFTVTSFIYLDIKGILTDFI